MFAILERGLRQAQSPFSTGSVTFPELAGALVAEFDGVSVAELAEATVFNSQTSSVHQDLFFQFNRGA
ncbi:MAG: hypothetical protein GX587_09710 [Bacteroidales bacterium]|nr:hypothetical protein [Bacteroidales bacterium]